MGLFGRMKNWAHQTRRTVLRAVLGVVGRMASELAAPELATAMHQDAAELNGLVSRRRPGEILSADCGGAQGPDACLYVAEDMDEIADALAARGVEDIVVQYKVFYRDSAEALH